MQKIGRKAFTFKKGVGKVPRIQVPESDVYRLADASNAPSFAGRFGNCSPGGVWYAVPRPSWPEEDHNPSNGGFMKTTRSIVLAVALVFAWATAGFAAHTVETCAKRIESFNYLVDYSGSMMMKYKPLGQTKMAMAKQIINRVNEMVPGLEYQGGLFTFAPYNTIVPQGPWNRDAIAQGVNRLQENLEIFGRFTPMGNGIQAHDGVIKMMPPRAAVILVTDGVSNRGVNPVDEVRTVYASNPNVCFHIISLADTPEGERTIAEIAALNSCTVVANGVDLLQSDAAVDKFVGDVFCQELIAIEEDVIVLRGVNFAFDSAALSPTAQGILNEAARVINDHPNMNVRLLGWTDSIGTDAYNLGLSQRRADSVKLYLVQHGVNPARMLAEGMGKSFRYDNATAEGRYMNRRTELVFSN